MVKKYRVIGPATVVVTELSGGPEDHGINRSPLKGKDTNAALLTFTTSFSQMASVDVVFSMQNTKGIPSETDPKGLKAVTGYYTAFDLVNRTLFPWSNISIQVGFGSGSNFRPGVLYGLRFEPGAKNNEQAILGAGNKLFRGPYLSGGRVDWKKGLVLQNTAVHFWHVIDVPDYTNVMPPPIIGIAALGGPGSWKPIYGFTIRITPMPNNDIV
jgi:hypothetical protein